jgi:hypothetical protein
MHVCVDTLDRWEDERGTNAAAVARRRSNMAAAVRVDEDAFNVMIAKIFSEVPLKIVRYETKQAVLCSGSVTRKEDGRRRRHG